MKAIMEISKALEHYLVRDIVKAPENDRALITQCVFKTKREAKGDFKRLKTILVASRNEKRFG